MQSIIRRAPNGHSGDPQPIEPASQRYPFLKQRSMQLPPVITLHAHQSRPYHIPAKNLSEPVLFLNNCEGSCCPFWVPVWFFVSLSVSCVYIIKGEERYSFSASTCDLRLLEKARPHTCCALWIQTAAGQICGMYYV